MSRVLLMQKILAAVCMKCQRIKAVRNLIGIEGISKEFIFHL